MHDISTTIRHIADVELPRVRDLATGSERPASEAELLNMDIVFLSRAPDGVSAYYTCRDQRRRDPDTLEWSDVGVASPGTVLSQGDLRQRHATLPAEHAPHILRAQVIRSSDPANPAAVVAAENVAEQAAMLAEHVGDVDGAPLVDLDHPDAVLEEAQRLVGVPGNGIDRHVVSMAAVTTGDVVETDRVIPHSWAGESPR